MNLTLFAIYGGEGLSCTLTKCSPVCMVPLHRQIVGLLFAFAVLAGSLGISRAMQGRPETLVEMYIRLCDEFAIEV